MKVLDPYIAGSNGPGPGGPDELTTDQSRLTYSFDYRGTHFLMLNTDPVDRDWRVPTRWIEGDLLAAQANGANHIFAIGHKPAFPWPQVPRDGLSRYPKVRDDFWNSMDVSGAEAMFAAHNHLWFKQQPYEGSPWQIIAGNGGSKLESGVTGEDAYFGFTLVTVYRNGQVLARSIGRDVPKEGYMAPSDDYPTSLRETVDVSH